MEKAPKKYPSLKEVSLVTLLPIIYRMHVILFIYQPLSHSSLDSHSKLPQKQKSIRQHSAENIFDEVLSLLR